MIFLELFGIIVLTVIFVLLFDWIHRYIKHHYPEEFISLRNNFYKGHVLFGTIIVAFSGIIMYKLSDDTAIGNVMSYTINSFEMRTNFFYIVVIGILIGVNGLIVYRATKLGILNDGISDSGFSHKDVALFTSISGFFISALILLFMMFNPVVGEYFKMKTETTEGQILVENDWECYKGGRGSGAVGCSFRSYKIYVNGKRIRTYSYDAKEKFDHLELKYIHFHSHTKMNRIDIFDDEGEVSHSTYRITYLPKTKIMLKIEEIK